MEEDDEYTEENPEKVPQAAPNAWDVARVLSMPLVGYFQGVAAMFDHMIALFILQSEIHDSKKAAQDMQNLLK